MCGRRVSGTDGEIDRHLSGFSISAWISSTRHAVVRGPNLTGGGKRPVFTPAHQLLLLTGIGPFGVRIADRRKNPVAVGTVECCRLPASFMTHISEGFLEGTQPLVIGNVQEIPQ
jgi:hypothetical protein